MGKKIEKHYGRAMDIEWAVDKDPPPAAASSLRRGPDRLERAQPRCRRRAAGSAMDYILSAMLTGKKVG